MHSDRENLQAALVGRERMVKAPRYHPLDVQTADPAPILGFGVGFDEKRNQAHR